MRRGAVDRGESRVQPVFRIGEGICHPHSKPPKARFTDRNQERCVAFDAAVEISQTGIDEVSARKRAQVHGSIYRGISLPVTI